jgi:hypothetical protein
MANDTIDIITEVREVRENGVRAAIAWGVTLASACLAVYTPLGNLKAVFITLAFIGAVGGLGGIWYTAAFVFHASTVFVLRVKPVWRLPVQIAIALAIPCLLSLYFLRNGMPTWATVETMFSWY